MISEDELRMWDTVYLHHLDRGATSRAVEIADRAVLFRRNVDDRIAALQDSETQDPGVAPDGRERPAGFASKREYELASELRKERLRH